MDGLAPNATMDKQAVVVPAARAVEFQSPPNSPNTITQCSSRPTSPAHDVPHNASSPVNPVSVDPVPLSQILDRPLHGRMADRVDVDRARRQDVTIQPRPTMPTSTASAPAGRLPRLLPLDTSAYIDASLPIATQPNTSTSLPELAHLIRLQKYRQQLRSQSRVKLHRWLVQAAVSARFLHCGELAHRTLIENFRSDNKSDFSRLCNALHDIRASCDATRRYAMFEPEVDNERRKLTKLIEPAQTFSTFLHEIPLRTRTEFLAFIDELRTNPDFLASRIASLSSQDLAALVSVRPPLDPRDLSSATSSKTNTNKSLVIPDTKPVERLLSFHRHDPLSTLIYTIFASSSGSDSAEDLRRTDTWATTCARLFVDCRKGLEPIVRSVLDAWSGMRGWSAKSNFELFLMDVLQDGQFLIDRYEAQGARSSIFQVTQTDKELDYAQEEFFERSVKKLFALIDEDSNAGGIPEGAVELGTLILRKLSGSQQMIRQAAETVIIHRWFFSCFLRNALLWPESHGIMIGYHISTRAREAILKGIHFHAQRQANAFEQQLAARHRQHPTSSGANIPQLPPVLPEIKAHMENILARFRHPRSSTRPILQPAKAITSPRETIEVQPFLVICPADLMTLVNSLFPDRRPTSSHSDLEAQRRGLGSSSSSISGISIPFRQTPISTPGDGSSILSQSASSAASGNTSHEPLLPSSRTETEQDVAARIAVLDGRPSSITCAPTEEYGQTLRAACREMLRTLGADALAGSCHPCAERWAVLYIDQDGKGLRTNMRKDTEDDEDDTEEDSDDDNDEDLSSGLHLESDYYQLKADVFRLLQEYEVPKTLVPESDFQGLSNRASHRRNLLRSHQPQTVGGQPAVALPLTHGNVATLVATQQLTVPTRQRPSEELRGVVAPLTAKSAERKIGDLEIMLEAAYHQCRERNQWVDAQRWHKTLANLKRLAAKSLTRNGFAALLNFFARGPREDVGKSFTALDEFDAWFAWLKQSLDRYDANIDDMMTGFRHLRDKMWFKTAVINSANYEEARNVAIALRTMGQAAKAADSRTPNATRARTSSRASNSFLLKTEAQVLELMTANEALTGPGKLSDEQADLTNQWLKRCGVENICKGEERIHRFCFEIDKCVNKLVGDSVLDGPVLWSSELYHRDRDILDSGRQKGDLFLIGVGTLSIAGDEEYETQSRGAPRSLDFVQRPPLAQSRTLTSRGSQTSFESSRWGRNAAGTNLMDSQDYFGLSSPAHTIDSTMTFWSPFQTQASAPASATQIRPNTSSSSRSTVMLKNTAAVNNEKRKFLLDLKQVLTGLLVSDLGTIVFTAGSETDMWFSGGLGEECAARKEADELERRKRLKRKSMKALKSAKASQDSNNKAERGSLGYEGHSAGDQSGSETTALSAGRLAVKRAGILDFPYDTAFRRILAKFATHPNPFTKLHALYELELLIVAHLTAKSSRNPWRKDPLPTVPQSPTLGSVPELAVRETTVPVQPVQTVEDSIANATTRRDHSMNQQQASGRESPTKSSASGARMVTLSTDMIVEVLQSLFKDAGVRPKTLFRDLQYIAALVPASMLDKTERGKAFWDATLAALGLKQEYVRYLVEIADGVIAEYEIKKRGSTVEKDRQYISGQLKVAETTSAPASSITNAPAQSSATGAATSAQAPAAVTQTSSVPKFTMADAARMMTITAKEGDSTSQRELAIFYLSHPDLSTRTVAPLSLTRNIFKNQSASPHAEKSKDGKPDQITMEVAFHWMKCAQMGGDDAAATYLKQQTEMDGLRG